MKTFAASIKYQDRKFGPTGIRVRVEATNLAGAIGKAGREFFKGLDRKQKFDANKEGVVVTVTRIADEVSE